MEDVESLIVGCGPAGPPAAREAASQGIEIMVLEKDAVVGAKRVCAAGLRPGFCTTFDLPRELIHWTPHAWPCLMKKATVTHSRWDRPTPRRRKNSTAQFKHRDALMRFFLERRARRFGELFEQLATTPWFPKGLAERRQLFIDD